MRNTKVKTNVSGKFKQGAYAILSKNILLMKKTNRLLTISDIMSMGLYIVITIFSDLGYGFFIYMLVIYIFSSLQQSELYNELQNYHIYLIPDKPFKKLIAVMIPTFIKVSLMTIISIIIVGIYYQVWIFNDYDVHY
ncbi:MAG: putative ABC exporter domain-containing protein [Coprobacillus cateniformis]